MGDDGDFSPRLDRVTMSIVSLKDRTGCRWWRCQLFLSKTGQGDDGGDVNCFSPRLDLVAMGMMSVVSLSKTGQGDDGDDVNCFSLQDWTVWRWG